MSEVQVGERTETLRRFKPYKAYRDSGVEWLGKIPTPWKALALKRIVDPARPVTYGIVQCGPECSEGIPYIRPVDMSDENGVKANALQRTAPEIAASYARSTVRPGDIVVSIGPSFGKAMIVPRELDGANLTQGTARIAPGPDVVPRFLFWVLRSNASLQAWDSYCSGATFRALTLEILETCKVTLPVSAEQRAIAAFLDRETAKIDALVAKKERLIELLQEQRTALISRAVTKGLDPSVPMKDSGIEWLGEIPERWDVKPLRWVLSVRSGEALSNSEFELAREEGLEVAVIGGNGVMGYTNRANTHSACIAIGRVGALCGNVHMVDPPAWVTDNALVISDITGFDRPYLALLLRVLDLNRWASQNAQPLITGGFLKGQRVCAPPDAEQRAIAAFLDRETARIDALVAKVRDAIDHLKELRTALISAAVTGKIDVREEVA